MRLVLAHTIHGPRALNLDQICSISPARHNQYKSVIIMANGKHYFFEHTMADLAQKLIDTVELVRSRCDLVEI